MLADRLAECRADGACTEEELLDIRDEMLARSLANDEALASCLTQACVEEHLAAVAGLEAFRDVIRTDLAARQIIGHALQRNAGVDVGLLAVLGARGGTSGPTFGPQDWALARAALNVANAETILQQCGQDAACMIAVANEIQADEAFVDLLRDLPGIGGVIAANDCVTTGDALTCAAVSVEALGAAGDMLQNGRRVLLRMGEDTVPATVRTTDEGVEVVTDAGDVVRVADAPKGGASNIATAQQLANDLRLASARSPFQQDGTLAPSALAQGREIIPESSLGNPNIPAGFGKYESPTFQSPSGDFKVHYYYNPSTNQVFYDLDYKVIFNHQGIWQ